MRLCTTLLLSGLLCATVNAAPQQPAGLQPLPPPPPLNAEESVEEPQITITKNSEWSVEEYRVGGRLYMIKIIPQVGPPYYLLDDQGDGKFSRRESLDSGVRPPRWVIHKF